MSGLTILYTRAAILSFSAAPVRAPIVTLSRHLVLAAVAAVLLIGAGFLGRYFVLPPPDNSLLRVVGMIEAPEVNITSRITRRIAVLELIEDP